MTDRERFLAVARGDKPDYVPIFGFDEAPGVSSGCMRTTYDRLLETGMPDVGGVWELDGRPRDIEGWRRYWGVTSSWDAEEFPGEPAKGFRWEKETKDGYEYIRCETGALTRQVVDNDITYSMPEFIRFHVRDRKSWEFYRERRTPGRQYSEGQMEALKGKYARRARPVRVSARATFGALRDIVGPEMACTIFYDDPDLAREILDWLAWLNREYVIPMVEAVRPDIVLMSEDICYNHGMMISPSMFRQFCMPAYAEMGEAVKRSGAAVFAVDTDGFAEQFAGVAAEAGVNAFFPWEVKAGNDLPRVRRAHPGLLIMGALEKECLNEDNAGLIRGEIDKAKELLAYGRYLPNADHGIQPLATFGNLCRFMTRLHEACGNPEGEYPKIY